MCRTAIFADKVAKHICRRSCMGWKLYWQIFQPILQWSTAYTTCPTSDGLLMELCTSCHLRVI